MSGDNVAGYFYPAIRSKFVFLLPQKLPRRVGGKLAFCSRWLQKGKKELRYLEIYEDSGDRNEQGSGDNQVQE